jgi:predicted RNase H-like HicB family nuclease
MTKMYLIYDGRAWNDPDDATVLDTADTLKEARQAVKEWPDACIYEYDVQGSELKNEKQVF